MASAEAENSVTLATAHPDAIQRRALHITGIDFSRFGVLDSVQLQSERFKDEPSGSVHKDVSLSPSLHGPRSAGGWNGAGRGRGLRATPQHICRFSTSDDLIFGSAISGGAEGYDRARSRIVRGRIFGLLYNCLPRFSVGEQIEVANQSKVRWRCRRMNAKPSSPSATRRGASGAHDPHFHYRRGHGRDGEEFPDGVARRRQRRWQRLVSPYFASRCCRPLEGDSAAGRKLFGCNPESSLGSTAAGRCLLPTLTASYRSAQFRPVRRAETSPVQDETAHSNQSSALDR